MTHTTESFVVKAHNVHKHCYSYVKTVFEHSHGFVSIGCSKHGDFLQRAYSHLNGAGCPECKKDASSECKRKSTGSFISEAMCVHGDRYNYDHVIYVNNKTPVSVECKEHGLFQIRPNDHLSKKSGCPKCYSFSSNAEKEWLDSMDVQQRQVSLTVDGVRYRVDGYDPETKTVYEFWGDMWHGNPDMFDSAGHNPINKIAYGVLYERTQTKRQNLINAGYQLVEIWESDWYANSAKLTKESSNG